MTRWMKITCVLIFVVGVLFCSVGYAALSGTLTIQGQIEILPPPYDEVVIIGASVVGNMTTANAGSPVVIPVTTLRGTISGAAGNKVVYKITAHNFSDNVIYAYAGTATESEAIKTGRVSVTVYAAGADGSMTNTPLTGTDVNPGEDITFYAVYTVNESVTDVSLDVNYRFGLSVESDGYVVPEGALTKFDEILNNQTKYEDLQKALDINTNRDFTGNVATGGLGAWIDGVFYGESKAVNDLFGEELKLEFVNDDGTTTPTTVTTIIQEKNVDGKAGNEMILYLAPYDIPSLEVSSNSTLAIYAVVFTQIEGRWYQIGDMYSGAADAMRWTTGISSGYLNADAFRPDSWEAGTPTLADNKTVSSLANTTYAYENFSYEVEAGTTIAALSTVKAAGEVIETMTALLSRASTIKTDIDQYAATDDLIAALDEAIAFAKLLDGMDDSLLTRAEVVAAVRDLELVLHAFRASDLDTPF